MVVPGVSCAPTERNHSDPFAMMPGTCPYVSTLLTIVGL